MAGRVISVSQQFLDTIRSSHKIALEATVYPPGGTPFDIPIEDGTVTVDRTAQVRRSLSLVCGDPSLYPRSTIDLLNVYGTEIIVKRGIEYADGSRELVQLGVFRVQDAQQDDPGGSIQITGFDRSQQIIDDRLLQPTRYDEQLGVDLIARLIRGTWPGALVNVTATDSDDTIKKHVVQQDRWAECLRVAQVLGAEVFADEQGNWVIQDVPRASDPPVYSVGAGPMGVLVSASNMVTREGAPSAVVVNGDSSPTTYAADTFSSGSRSSGLGVADIGGQYNYISGSAGDWDISSGRGEAAAAQGATKFATLSINESDVDTYVNVRFEGASGTANGGDLHAGLALRVQSNQTYLLLDVQFDNGTGHTIIQGQHVNGGSPTNVGGSKNLGAYTSSSLVYLRFRLKGTSFQWKAWDSSSGGEPRSWDVATTQSSISAAGDVGYVVTRGNANTTPGPQFGVDSLKCTALAAWYSVAYDDDPRSPTYYLGPFGLVPRFVSNPLIKSQVMGDRVAATQLRNHLGVTRSVNFSAVPNPALDAGDVVEIVYENGLVENHVIDVVTIPLAPSGEMTGETRASDWSAS
jgi:hypothetical protein